MHRGRGKESPGPDRHAVLARNSTNILAFWFILNSSFLLFTHIISTFNSILWLPRRVMWTYELNRHSNLESHLIIKHQFHQIELYSSLLNDVLLSENSYSIFDQCDRKQLSNVYMILSYVFKMIAVTTQLVHHICKLLTNLIYHSSLIRY